MPRTQTGTHTMSRRQLLAAAAMTPLAASLASASPLVDRATATFVLVHGAWHGGWCWKKLAPLLRADGHQVLTPTLTGLGERSHLLNDAVDLEMHIQDIVAVIESEDVDQVVLVGHSYGGMVVTGVADRIANRIAQLVYLDAFLPQAGKALTDYAPLPKAREDGWRVPVPGTASQFGVKEAQDIAWVQPRLGDQPIKTFTQPLRQSLTQLPVSKQTFIRCSNTAWFAEAGTRAKGNGARYHELLSAGHDAMITQPQAVKQVLGTLV